MLFTTYTLILALSSLLGILRFFKLKMPFKILCILLIYSTFSEIITRTFQDIYNNSNPVYHLYAPISLSLYSSILYYLIPNKTIQKIVFSIGITIIPLSLINSIYIQKIIYFPSNIVFISMIILSAYSIMLFYYMLKSPKSLPIIKDPIFWLASGTLIFQAASFFEMGFNNLVYNKLSYERQLLVNEIHLFFPMLMYAMYGVALYLDGRRSAKK